METKAHFVLIGVFTLVVISGAFALVLFFSGFSGFGGASPRKTYEIVFNGSVAGLARGSSVLFNGLKVGEVASVHFVADDPSHVAAFVQIFEDAPIRADTKARLDTQGLTGGAVIALTGGAPNAPEVANGPNGGPPVLRGEPSQLQSVLENVASLSAKADEAITKADKLIGDNSDAVKDIIGNVDRFSKALGDNASGVNGALASVGKLGETMGPVADHIAKLADVAAKDLAAVDPDKVRTIVNDVSEFTSAVSQNKEAVTSLLSDSASLAKRLNEASVKLSGTIDSIDKAAKAIDAEKISRLVDDADKTFAAVDPAKISGIVNSVSQFAGAISEDKDAVKAAIADGASLAKRLDDASAKLGGTIDKLGGTIDDVDKLAKAVDAGKVASLVDSADKVAKAIDAEKVSRFIDNADKTLAAVDPGKVSTIVNDVSQFTSAISADKDAIKSLIADGASLAKQLNDASAKLGGAIDDFDKVAKAVDPAKVSHLVDSADKTLAAVDPAKVSAIVGDVSQFSGALAADKEAVKSLIADAASLAKRLNEASDKLSGTISDIDGVAKAVDREKIAHFLDGADALGGALASNRDNIDHTIKNTSELAAKLNGSADKLDGLMTSAQSFLGSPDTKGPLSDIGDAAKSLRRLTDDLDQRIKEVSGGLIRFSTSGLREYEALAVDGRRTVNDLDKLLHSLQKNPSQILFGAGSSSSAPDLHQ